MKAKKKRAAIKAKHGISIQWIDFAKHRPPPWECVLVSDGRRISIGQFDTHGLPIILLEADGYDFGHPICWTPLPTIDFDRPTNQREHNLALAMHFSAHEPFGPISVRSTEMPLPCNG